MGWKVEKSTATGEMLWKISDMKTLDSKLFISDLIIY